MALELDKKRSLFIWIAIFVTVVVTLACGGINPSNENLQPPLSNLGVKIEDFLEQLKTILFGKIMAPWIVEPPDFLFEADSSVTIKGWAPFLSDASLVVYQVEPNAQLTSTESDRLELARTTVGADYSWSVEVTLPEQRQYIAARLEQSGLKRSPFSNIVYISRGKPASLEIITPQNDDVVLDEKITLTGSGEPRDRLTLIINGESTEFNTVVNDNGSWTLSDVPIIIKGFDASEPQTDLNRNELIVSSQVTGQSDSVFVQRINPIQLIWPYDSGEEEINNPNPAGATITAFAGNDWHRYYKLDEHQAFDMTIKDKKIRSVSKGKVVFVSEPPSCNAIIIDSGGWGVLYFHIKDSDEYVSLGMEVEPGEIIATQGLSCTKYEHLHLEVRVWPSNADRSSLAAFWKSYEVNINPPIKNAEYFRKKNVDLFDLWGDSDYCVSDGCWKDVDWRMVKLSEKTTPGAQYYKQGCWLNGSWIVGEITNDWYGLTTRALYCKDHPDQCLCPSQ